MLAIGLVAAAIAVVLWFINGIQTGFHNINNLAILLPAPLWENITFMGNALILIAISTPLLKRYPELAWAMLLAFLIGGSFVEISKYLLDTLRPASVLPRSDFNQIGPLLLTNSMPSGHSLTVFTFACLWIYYLRSPLVWLLLLLFASIVAISRIIVGAHWPVDVLVGAAAGALIAMTVIVLAARWRWGLRPLVQRLLIGLYLLCTVALIFVRDGSRDVDGLAITTAIIMLLISGRVFCGNLLPVALARVK